VFAARLDVIHEYDIATLKLGKKATEQYAQAVELHKQFDRYAYGGPRVRFCDEEIDQARAAGVTIEFEHGAPLVVDRSLYRELVKHAIARTVSQLEARVAEQAAERLATRNARRSQVADPLVEPSARSAGSCVCAASRRTASTSISERSCSPGSPPSTRRT
jgi:hypothetical protein